MVASRLSKAAKCFSFASFRFCWVLLTAFLALSSIAWTSSRPTMSGVSSTIFWKLAKASSVIVLWLSSIRWFCAVSSKFILARLRVSSFAVATLFIAIRGEIAPACAKLNVNSLLASSCFSLGNLLTMRSRKSMYWSAADNTVLRASSVMPCISPDV